MKERRTSSMLVSFSEERKKERETDRQKDAYLFESSRRFCYAIDRNRLRRSGQHVAQCRKYVKGSQLQAWLIGSTSFAPLSMRKDSELSILHILELCRLTNMPTSKNNIEKLFFSSQNRTPKKGGIARGEEGNDTTSARRKCDNAS